MMPSKVICLEGFIISQGGGGKRRKEEREREGKDSLHSRNVARGTW